MNAGLLHLITNGQHPCILQLISLHPGYNPQDRRILDEIQSCSAIMQSKWSLISLFPCETHVRIPVSFPLCLNTNFICFDIVTSKPFFINRRMITWFFLVKTNSPGMRLSQIFFLTPGHRYSWFFHPLTQSPSSFLQTHPGYLSYHR